MLFNSLFFLLIFLPLAWGGFRWCAWINHRLGIAWLVAVSLLFYGWWTPAYLVLLCCSIIFNYSAGIALQKTVEKPSLQTTILAFGVAANLLLLGYYKYLFPLLHWFERFGFHLVPPDASILLPLGISFFTFTQIGYLIDCRAGLTSGRRFLDYILFVSFFPHLIAGPILHHREMMPQFEARETWRFNLDNIAIGFSIFFIGLAKKDLVADSFAYYANFAFAHPGALTVGEAWCGVFSYSMQLYFDFSGYTEMAIGLALLFNIRFPANFDSPYKSACIIDFWQRWHMTLTRYLNLYLYNPIALWVARSRSEKGLEVGRQALRTVSGFSTMLVFPTFTTLLLIGIWHGAGLQFAVFGLLHAFYLVTNHAWRLAFHKKGAPKLAGPALWLSTVWKVGLTYFAVLIAQVFFRASSVSDALVMLNNMFGQEHLTLPSTAVFPAIYFHGVLFLFTALFILVAPNVLQIFAPWEPTLSKPHSLGPAWYKALEWRPTAAYGIALGLLAALAILAVTGQSEFLYFRF